MSERPTFDLWCLDNGDRLNECRYLGPFRTLDAVRARKAASGGDDRPLVTRRCRRLQPSELDAFKRLLESIEDVLNDGFPVPDEAWADWEEQLVEQTEVSGIHEALRLLVDRGFQTNVYLCEPEGWSCDGCGEEEVCARPEFEGVHPDPEVEQLRKRVADLEDVVAAMLKANYLDHDIDAYDSSTQQSALILRVRTRKQEHS